MLSADPAHLTILFFLLPVCFRCDPSSTWPASGGSGEPGACNTPGTGGLLWLWGEEERGGGTSAGGAAGRSHGAAQRTGALEHQRKQCQAHGDEETAPQAGGTGSSPAPRNTELTTRRRVQLPLLEQDTNVLGKGTVPLNTLNTFTTPEMYSKHICK